MQNKTAVAAWAQWCVFIKSHTNLLTSGKDGIEIQAFDLLPSVAVGDRVARVFYNARKKRIAVEKEYVINDIIVSHKGQIEFDLGHYLAASPFRLSKNLQVYPQLTEACIAEWPYSCFIPKKWLNLSLDQLSHILHQLQELVETEAYLDQVVTWGEVRANTKIPLTRNAIRHVLAQRFKVGKDKSKIKLTLLEICAYIALRELEKEGKPITGSTIIDKFVQCAEKDMLLLVQTS